MLLDWVIPFPLSSLYTHTDQAQVHTRDPLPRLLWPGEQHLLRNYVLQSLQGSFHMCGFSTLHLKFISLHISLAQLDVWHRKMRTLYASLWRSSPVFQLMSLSHGGSSELCLSQTSELWSFGYVFPLNRSSSVEYTEYEQSERIKSRQKSPFSLPNLKRSLCCWQWVSHWLEGHPQRKVIYDLELETENGKQAWITWGSVAGTL